MAERAESVGQIGLDLVVNQNQFKQQMSGIMGMAKKAGTALAAAFAVKKIVDFGKSCIDLGSDLAEVQNVVDVTFPHMADQVDKFAKSAASSYGLSETMAKKYSGTFGSMAKAFGFTEKQALDMGTSLTALTGDVASFYNLNQDEAYTKLKSVFTGETESLKDLGVVMTQTALDSYAMANGFGKTTSQMSEAEKVALRYQFVANQLSAAQGDFARTSGGWANQVRILSLQFDSLKATIGQGLINVLTPVLKVINTLLGKLSVLASAFKSFTELITGQKASAGSSNGVAAVAGSAADAGDSLESASDSAADLTSNTNKAGNAAKKAAKQMKSLMGFDKINKLDKPTTDTGSSSKKKSTSPGAAVPAVDFGGLAEGDTVIDQVDGKFQKMFSNIQKLCEPAVQSLKRLWDEGLSRLGNFTWNALKGFFDNFLVPVGKWTLGKGIPRFVDALNNGLMKVNFGKIEKALNGLWKALAPFAVKVGEGLLWLWEHVLVPFGTWTANEVVPRYLETISIVVGALNKVIEKVQPLFQWFWENVLDPLAKWTGGMFLQAWDSVNQALKTFGDWCAEHIPTVGELSDKFQDMKKWVNENKTAIELVAIVLGGFTTALIANTVASNAMAISQGAASAAVAFYNGVTAIATGVTTAFGAVLSFLTSPITLVIAAITALIAVGVLVYKNWDTIKAKAVEIWGAIKQWFSDTCKKIGDFFAGLWKGIKETFASVGEWFKEKFEAARDNIHAAFSAIGEWFKDRWTDIKNALASVGTWFKDTFESAYKNVTNAFSGIKTFFKSCWTGIKEAFGNIAKWFGDTFEKAWRAVKNVFSKGGEVFEGIKDGILENLKAVINGLIDGINNVVTIPFDGINSALRSLRELALHIGPYTAHPFSWLPTIPTPQIPRLAQGGYVKPNTPQLAMIGDNRHQGEVVAPEDKLQAMVDEAVSRSGGGSISRNELEGIINRAVMRIIAALANLGFAIDGETIAKARNLAQVGIDRRFNTVDIA